MRGCTLYVREAEPFVTIVSRRSAELTIAHAGMDDKSNWISARRTGLDARTRSFVSLPLFWVTVPASIHASFAADKMVVTSAGVGVAVIVAVPVGLRVALGVGVGVDVVVTLQVGVDVEVGVAGSVAEGVLVAVVAGGWVGVCVSVCVGDAGAVGVLAGVRV